MSRSRNEKGKPKYNNDWQSAELNWRTYLHYYYYFQEIAVNRVKILNLPRSVDERFLQLTLHRNGVAVFFKPWFSSQCLCTQATPSGRWNIYDNPTEITSWGNNGWTYRMGMDKGVLIWLNRSRMTTHNTCDLYARKLADLDRQIEINLKALKTPIIITCPEDKRESFTDLYKQYDGNEPLVFGVDGMMEDVQFNVFKTDAPYLVDKYLRDKHNIINEFFTFMGIGNANQDKRERLVTDEVNANNDQIEIMKLSTLDSLRECFDVVNERYYDRLERPIEVVWNADNISDNYDFRNNDQLYEETMGGNGNGNSDD